MSKRQAPQEATGFGLPFAALVPLQALPQILSQGAKKKGEQADEAYRKAANVKSPQIKEDLYSPAEAGILAGGGILASALGVDTRDINAFGQAYERSKAGKQEREYANKKQKAEDERNKYETEGKLADREAARYKQASDEMDARRRWEAEQAQKNEMQRAQLASLDDSRKEAVKARGRDDYKDILDRIASGNFTKEHIPGLTVALKGAAEAAGYPVDSLSVDIKNAITNGDFKKMNVITDGVLRQINFEWANRRDAGPADRKRWAQSITNGLNGALGLTSIDTKSPEFQTYLTGVLNQIPDGQVKSAVEFDLRQKQLLDIAKMNDARQAKWQSISVDKLNWDKVVDTTRLGFERIRVNNETKKMLLGEVDGVDKKTSGDYEMAIAEATRGISVKEKFLERVKNASDAEFERMSGAYKWEGDRATIMQGILSDLEFEKELLAQDKANLAYIKSGGGGAAAGAQGGQIGAGSSNVGGGDKPPKWLTAKQRGYWEKGYRPDDPSNPNTTWHGPGG